MIKKDFVVNVGLGFLFMLAQISSVAQAGVSYAPPASTLAGGGPEFIAKGHLNGDSDIDLVTVNASGGAVSVLLGDGTGGFSRVNYAVGVQPRTVAIGDLDGDTDNDLVVTNTDTPGIGTITVLLNDGNGVFTEANESPIDIEALAGPGAEPSTAVIAQLNSTTDAIPDIAIGNDITDNVQILLGDGDGTFTAGALISVGDKPISMAAADIHWPADTFTDLVVANLSDHTVNVLVGDGLGGFSDASGSPFAAGNSPFSVQIKSIDIVMDAIPDIALVNHADPPQTVRVFKGVGDGTFTPLFVSAALAAKPHGVEVADLDADGNPDLAVASDSTSGTLRVPAVTVLLGDGAGSFSSWHSIRSAESPILL